MLTGDAFANRFVEQEFFAWADAVGLAEKLRTMRLARVSDGESFGFLTNNPRIDSPAQLDMKLVEAEQVTSPILALDSYRYLDGIRFDEHGNPISYDVLREHPGDDAFSLTENYDTIDADSILHFFRCDRPGQIRGIPDITPTLPLFAQLRRFTLAVLDVGPHENPSRHCGLMAWSLSGTTRDSTLRPGLGSLRGISARSQL